MNDSYMTVSGNVTADPILRTGSSGQQYVTFRVASTPRRFDARTRTWGDGETTYLSVIAFNALAVNVAASISRGQPVVVHGRVRARTWGDQTRQITSLELQASTVGHNLVFGESTFTKVGREQVELTDRLSDPLLQGDLRALGEQAPRLGEPSGRGSDSRPDPDADEACGLGQDGAADALPEHTDPWAQPVDVTSLIDVTGSSDGFEDTDAVSVEHPIGSGEPGADPETGQRSTWAAYPADPETDDYLVRRAG